MKLEKPRMFTSTRDLLISLGVLGAVMLFSVGFTGLCSWDPGPADKSGPVQEVDIDTILDAEARSLNFPLRNPDVPSDWEANSGRRISVDQEPSAVAGWVVDERYFISLTQTGVDPETAVDDVDEDIREETDTHSSDSADGAVTWHIFTGDDARSVWAADLGDVTLLLEGTATQEIYETLADEVVTTAPIDPAA
ncbi:MAG: DUF4245 domain-containing protein [Mycobacteriaceae bacterium]